jgi:hypothetical protein
VERRPISLVYASTNHAFCQDWVNELGREVEAERMKPRTFNRRIAAISSLYRWASEPCRCPVTEVPRNLVPKRSLLQTPKTKRGISEKGLATLLAVNNKALFTAQNLRRDYYLIKGAYWLKRTTNLVGSP